MEAIGAIVIVVAILAAVMGNVTSILPLVLTSCGFLVVLFSPRKSR